MAHFTQAQCDNCQKILTRKQYESDGTTFKDFIVEVVDENGNFYTFIDTVSTATDDDATRLTNAHNYLKGNCEFASAPVQTIDPPIQIQ